MDEALVVEYYYHREGAIEDLAGEHLKAMYGKPIVYGDDFAFSSEPVDDHGNNVMVSIKVNNSSKETRVLYINEVIYEELPVGNKVPYRKKHQISVVRTTAHDLYIR